MPEPSLNLIVFAKKALSKQLRKILQRTIVIFLKMNRILFCTGEYFFRS